MATQDNIERFTEGRFSPSGLATEAPPVSGPEHPKPQALSLLPPPEALLNQPTLLLLHPDDLCIGDSLQHHPMVKGRVWLSQVDDDHAWPQSDKARCFVKGAVDDLAQADDWVLHQSEPEAIDRIAKELGVAQIVTMAPPVGPTQSWMDTWLHTLSIPVTQARRAYDATLWPLATKGFFPFKERVLSSPSLIETMV